MMEKMPWQKIFNYIQDGAKAHTADGSVRELEEAGSDPLTIQVADRVSVKFLTQPAQSPDVNVNDCAFFSSLQAQIMKQVAMDLIVPMEDYHECVRLVREYRRAHPLE